MRSSIIDTDSRMDSCADYCLGNGRSSYRIIDIDFLTKCSFQNQMQLAWIGGIQNCCPLLKSTNLLLDTLKTRHLHVANNQGVFKTSPTIWNKTWRLDLGKNPSISPCKLMAYNFIIIFVHAENWGNPTLLVSSHSAL